MSVKFIDDGVLSSIAAQLRLTNLRKIDEGPVPNGDLAYDLNGPDGKVIARFAWTPKQPGAEIVHNVVPFILVALIGFALILRPLVVVADFVPLIGSILGAGAALVAAVCTAVLAPVVIAIAWFWYRPLVSVVALVIGLGIAFGFRTLAARKAAARAPQPAGTFAR